MIDEAPVASARLGVVDATIRVWLRLPFLVRALVPCCLMACLWWSSSQPVLSKPPSSIRPLLHNFMHVVAYAALAAATWLAVPPTTSSSRRNAGSFVVALCYGIVDELHQSHVPGRVCSVADVLTDGCGAALALAWLEGRAGERHRGGAVKWWLLACLMSTALATWGPW